MARQELERNLSETGIEGITDIIASGINGYDAIADAIYKKELK